MSKKSLLAVASCAVVIAGASASAAFAGEVTGPPGTYGEKDTTHANSICSFSGLNDGDPPGGQTQSYGQDVRAGRADPTAFNPGDACQGGSNPDRP
jgi:hypothetical protein